MARGFQSSGVTLVERPAIPKLRVQRMPGVADRAEGLPAEPNTVRGADPWALWLAPAEWLVYAFADTRASLIEMVDPWVRTGSHVCADVSSGLSLLELSGPNAIELLAAGCGLDLEGDAVPQSRCAQTLFHQVPLILHRPGGAELWRLIVDRSVSAFLCDSLCSAHEVRSLRSR